MRKGIAVLLSVLVSAQGAVCWAAPNCERPQDALALRASAMQQEMMVAALVCHDIEAYNHFVLGHRSELQNSDRALQAFFLSNNIKSGFEDYNAFKTERANAFSLRSLRDPQFCEQMNADFKASEDRPLEALLAELPFPADTGSISCTAPYTRPATTEAELTQH